MSNKVPSLGLRLLVWICLTIKKYTNAFKESSFKVYSSLATRTFPMVKVSGKRKLFFDGEDKSDLVRIFLNNFQIELHFKFFLQLPKMEGLWDLDDFCLAEASSLVELVSGLVDRNGDLAR